MKLNDNDMPYDYKIGRRLSSGAEISGIDWGFCEVSRLARIDLLEGVFHKDSRNRVVLSVDLANQVGKLLKMEKIPYSLGVVRTDFFDNATVTLGARVGNDDAVERGADFAHPLEANLDCHESGVSLLYVRVVMSSRHVGQAVLHQGPELLQILTQKLNTRKPLERLRPLW